METVFDVHWTNPTRARIAKTQVQTEQKSEKSMLSKAN